MAMRCAQPMRQERRRRSQLSALRLLGRVAAGGETFNGELGSGSAVPIVHRLAADRAARMPSRMQEDTRTESDRPDEVQILDPVKPWEKRAFSSAKIPQRRGDYGGMKDAERWRRIVLLAAMGLARKGGSSSGCGCRRPVRVERARRTF